MVEQPDMALLGYCSRNGFDPRGFCDAYSWRNFHHMLCAELGDRMFFFADIASWISGALGLGSDGGGHESIPSGGDTSAPAGNSGVVRDGSTLKVDLSRVSAKTVGTLPFVKRDTRGAKPRPRPKVK